MAVQTGGPTTYKWCLVALAFFEVLTATGVMFGWSAMSLALQREGVYANLCDAAWLPEAGPCDAQVLRLNVIYSAAATCIPLSFMAWGPAMDKWGAKAVRLSSLAFFIGGTLLFAFASAGDSVVDAYTVAGCLVSLGGGGFFFSHFVIAEHFKGTHFGLVHTIVNGAFDASTATMVALEASHDAGLSLRGCFLCLAGLGCLYVALSFDCVWQGLLAPPPAEDVAETGEDAEVELKVAADPAATGAAAAPTAAPAAAPQYGAALDVSHRPLRGQFLSVHFLAIACWALVAVFRTMFVLGTIGPQLQYNGGGRGAERVEELVRIFNWLILSSVPLTPAFGWFLDRFGLGGGFALVNTLGILCFIGLGYAGGEGETAMLSFSFIAYGCFRAFNYSTMTAFIQGVFGHATFGTIYGIGVGIVSVIAAAIQYPTTEWAVRSVEDGLWDSFVPLDLGAGVVLSGVLFGFPAWLIWVGRREKDIMIQTRSTLTPIVRRPSFHGF